MDMDCKEGMADGGIFGEHDHGLFMVELCRILRQA